jgi:carbonic anhydrase
MNFKSIITSGLFPFSPDEQEFSASEALKKLKEGNKRFVAGKLLHPNDSPERRAELYEAQNPFAIIFGCSDSRVPPELIFDQGLGDIFVIRVAAHVADQLSVASIEFAAKYFRIPLLVVMGHEQCGAIIAASSGKDLGENLNSLGSKIKPSIDAAKEKGDENLISRTIELNVRKTIEELPARSEIIKEFVNNRKLMITGAVYDMKSGEVKFL